jgi:hypothetical protein
VSIDVFELVPITSQVVERLYAAWLKPHVEGLTIERADREAYAYHLALALRGDLPCACGHNLCAHQHTLTALSTSGKTLAAFVYRAVIGPAGLKTNSIAQGMLFPYLQQEHGLQVGMAAHKQCDHPTCHRQYEGAICPFCRTPFCPDTTALVGTEWLVVKGERGYLPVQYWRCGSGGYTHFYPQTRCRGGGRHSITHDRCPWHACPVGNPLHGQRSTTLWVRARFLRVHSEAHVSPQFGGVGGPLMPLRAGTVASRRIYGTWY